MVVAYNTSIVRSGLVLHVDAANKKSYTGSGTAWNDLSGNGNHGTNFNGVSYDLNNNGTMLYDGTNDYSSFPTWQTLKGSNWGGNLSMEFCFKTIISPPNTFMGYVGFSSANAYFRFMNTANLFLDSATNQSTRINTTAIVGMNSSGFGKWFHVCGVYDGVAKTYVNGSLINTSTAFTLADISSLNFTVGFGMGYYNFNGNISSVKLYNRALSVSEVRQNFDALRGRYGI